ncbi:hypothetical protein VHUM_00091 [Vanrija humicola]|uniref:Uncharacterized protein n=1 Tax=Vanrija humicola TaxID=5417 RepID=A0A7D8V5N3_VANHU|nr:hypothetical protein VHUM_00091 [Vanrija humicola]
MTTAVAQPLSPKSTVQAVEDALLKREISRSTPVEIHSLRHYSAEEAVAIADRGRGAASAGRGRDSSPKALVYASGSSPPPGGLPGLPPRRRSSAASTSLDAHDFHSHHQPPAATAEPNDEPILYLPPLLSGLPHSVAPEDPSTRGEFDTRLPHIDPASLALHQALHHFHPVDNHYASTEYPEAFNWRDLSLPEDVEREWYVVVFRSRRRPESESLSLYAADRAAHAEAVANGGLILYWYGVPDHTGLNMATCIWQSRKHAVNAISGPKHMEAMKEAAGAYETYNLERWRLQKVLGSTKLRLARWEGGDVGW